MGGLFEESLFELGSKLRKLQSRIGISLAIFVFIVLEPLIGISHLIFLLNEYPYSSYFSWPLCAERETDRRLYSFIETAVTCKAAQQAVRPFLVIVFLYRIGRSHEGSDKSESEHGISAARRASDTFEEFTKSSPASEFNEFV